MLFINMIHIFKKEPCKSTRLFLCFLSMACVAVQAQSISFSMTDEAAAKNTPEGWTEVQLPNIPAITAANTFYITDYGASTTSTDNTAAIQAALDAANTAGGGMVVVPAGEWLFGRITVGSKTVLHLCANATLKLLAYNDQPDHTTKVPYITGKSNASDIVIEGESKTTSIIEGQGGPWWDAVEQKESGLQRGAIIRFHQGQRYLFRHFRIQNARLTEREVRARGILYAEVAEQVTLTLIEADDGTTLQARLFLLDCIPPGAALTIDDGGFFVLALDHNIGGVALASDIGHFGGVVGLVVIGQQFQCGIGTEM